MYRQAHKAVFEWGKAGRGGDAAAVSVVDGSVRAVDSCMHCSLSVLDMIPVDLKRWMHVSSLLPPKRDRVDWLPDVATTPIPPAAVIEPVVPVAELVAAPLPALAPTRKQANKPVEFKKAKGMAGASLVRLNVKPHSKLSVKKSTFAL